MKKDAIPSIFQNQNEIDSNVINVSKKEECPQCIQKDKIISDIQQIQASQEEHIQQYQSQIKTLETKMETLKRSLKKARNRAYYLDSCNSKLNNTISFLKEQKLVDEKLLKAIEVRLNHFNS